MNIAIVVALLGSIPAPVASHSTMDFIFRSSSYLIRTEFESSSNIIVDEFEEFVSRAWQARDKRDWDEMARNLSAAWRIRMNTGGIDRFGVGLYHALTFAYIRTGDLDLAVQSARSSLTRLTEASSLQEWIGAHLQMAEAASLVGDFKTSSDCIRRLERHRSELGPSSNSYRDVLDRSTNKEFRFSFKYAYEQFPKEFDNGLVLAFLPRTDLPYQSASFEVVGARKYNKRQKGEQVWLEVEPNAREPFYVRGSVKQLATSFWTDIKALKSAKALDLESSDPYLGESYGVSMSGPGADIARSLKGKSQWETIRNVARWMDENIPYVIDGSDKFIIHANDALVHRKGVCNPRALAAVKLMRLCGVPCRVVRGMGSFTTPPGWHTWIEIRSPITDPGGKPRWVPTDVGSTVTDFPLHLGIQFYPSVAPFSDRAFEWEQWYPFNIETVEYTKKKMTLPDSGEQIPAL
ncbi:MAG TPA: transglutaminase-like domain-containing protein [Fimbriimonadaceae bacterium]|nr:transglutaminase-like domain-containing protein [Fimbriimonadaceae bacterium]